MTRFSSLASRLTWIRWTLSTGMYGPGGRGAHLRPVTLAILAPPRLRPHRHLLGVVVAPAALLAGLLAAAPTLPAGTAAPEAGPSTELAGDIVERPRPVRPRGPEIAPPEAAVSPFLLEATDVRATVTGPVAHVVVTQKWSNPNAVPVDGLYIFPLPENAAVNDMSLKIGDRLIEGRMLRREEARAVYEQARTEGRVAGLLDQERANVFAQQVANIMPGMAIDVVIAFDHEIECEAGRCEYVFPTVVGPRFIPADQTDPGRIDPPVVAEGSRTRQRLTLAVDINAGVAIRDLASPSHRITLARPDSTRARAKVAEGAAALLNRDFRLRWRLGSDRPELGVLAWRDAEKPGEAGIFTLLIQPPVQPSDEQALPRELFFVLDCSGSMSGVPIEAAKNVVRRALRAARPGDTFQILRFSENVSGLGEQPLEPTPANLQRALRYLDTLHGQGGTHMLAGIRAALEAPRDPERLRIVAFLTDGYIGNERDILAAVRRNIGKTRLFSFGIGSSVNRYLLEGLAEEGRGVAAFLGPRETPDEMVDRFIKRIETPVLTDIRIHFEDVDAQDLEPGLVPDLFAGQSVLVHGRYTRPGTGLVIVEGNVRGRTEVLSRVLILPERKVETEALGRLWARARIHRLERQLHDGPRDDVKEAIVQLGLRHRLMTAWTSLVAVDSVVSNHGGERTSVQVPVEMPEDVAYQGIFGAANGRQRFAKLKAVSSFSLAPVASTEPPPASRVAYAQSAGRERVDALKAPRDKDAVTPGKASRGPRQGNEDEEKSQNRGNAEVARGTVREGEDTRAGWRDTGPSNEMFARLVLITASGVRVEVERDGEVWVIDGSRRTLAHVLDAVALERVRFLLASAGAGSWSADPGQGARLVVEAGGRRLALPLPAGNRPATRLATLLESWTRQP